MRLRCVFLLVIFVSAITYGHESSCYFIKNKGQWKNDFIAKVDVPGGALFLENNRLTFNFVDHQQIKDAHDNHTPLGRMNGHAFQWTFLDANNPQISFQNNLLGVHNYYLSTNNAVNLKSYQLSTYLNIYDFIDYRIYGYGNSLKYDWIVKKGGNPKDIKLQIDGVENIKIVEGRLHIRTSVNHLIEEAPFAYQIINGEQVKVECRFKLKNKKLSFIFPDGYDKNYDLIIDPLMIFSTFSGSTASNFGFTATNDENGFLYSGGVAFDIGYPTTIGAYQTDYNGGVIGTDIVLTKYSQDGTSLEYSTYLGGASDEVPHSLIVYNDELFMLGTTGSLDFPATANAFDNTFNSGPPLLGNGIGINYTNGCDIVVSRFSADGTELIASTFLGGTDNDGFNNSGVLRFNYADQIRGEIDIDEDGNCYVASSTFSTDFPIVGGQIQANNNGSQEGVIVKINLDLSEIDWSSYWGGSGDDAIYSLSFNETEIYISGGTTSSDFTVTNNAYATNYLGGVCDAFVSRFPKSGDEILSSTFFGSNQYDQAYFIEMDSQNDIYIFGQSLAPDLTLVDNANFFEANSAQFVAKLNGDLSNQIFSTVFGSGSGQIDISPTAFLVDACNRVYCSGWGGATNSVLNGGPGGSTTNLTTTFDAFQSTTDGSDFYLIILEDNGNTLSYASFFGGPISNEHVDGGTSRFDKQGIVYQSVCAGCGGNSDFPTTPGAYSSQNNSTNCNNAVFKYDPQFPLTIANFNVVPFTCDPNVTFENISLGDNNTYEWNFGDGTTSNEFNPTHEYSSEGIFEVTLYSFDPISCNMVDSITKEVEIRFNIYEQADDLLICNEENVLISGTAIDGFEYEWTPSQFLSNPNSIITTFNPESSGEFTYFLVGVFENCSDTLEQSILVEGSISAQFITPSVSCDLTVPFQNSSQSENSYDSFWQFGDGQTSEEQNPINDYNSYDLFEVVLVVTDSLACNISDTVSQQVLLRENIFEVLDTTNICSGESILITAPSEPEFEYSWIPSLYLQTPNEASTLASPTDTITYFRIGTSNNCADTVIQTINVSDVDLSFNSLVEYCSNQFYLTASSNDSIDFVWSATPSFITSVNTDSFLINSPGTYYVSVNANGCYKVGEINAQFDSDCCTDKKIIVPNAFSPNGDLINDYFEIQDNNQIVNEFELQIFNRWGQKVFQSNNINLKWDGYFKGKPQPSSVFDYHLTVGCLGGDQHFFKKGDVTLIR